jgi:NAD(P)-dependent dehydrogenase (short-subunit alcohol dehydrogenase family)
MMSSELGSVADNDDGRWEVYRASKAALNTLMRSFAARHRGDPRAMLVVTPGWVRTDSVGREVPLASRGASRASPCRRSCGLSIG